MNELSDLDVALGERRLKEKEQELQAWAERLKRISDVQEARAMDIEAGEQRLRRINATLAGLDVAVNDIELRRLDNHANNLNRVASELAALASAATHRARRARAALERKKRNGQS